MNIMNQIRVILSLMLLAMISLPSYSQDTDGKYLFRDSKVRLSTFYVEINPSTSFSFLNGQIANISELTAGFILNNKFYFSYFMTGSPKINTVAIPIKLFPGVQDLCLGLPVDSILRKIKPSWACLIIWSGRPRSLPWNPILEEV